MNERKPARYSCHILMKLEKFLDRFFSFSRSPHITYFMKVHPVGVGLLHADSDGHEEDDGRFSKFCENA